MKIYVAGHNQKEAISVADILQEAGHVITSSWLHEDFEKTGEYTHEQKESIACRDIREIYHSDAIVMLSSPRRVAGGKFVEFGVAIGYGKKLFLIGARENMLMYFGPINQFSTVEDLLSSGLI